MIVQEIGELTAELGMSLEISEKKHSSDVKCHYFVLKIPNVNITGAIFLNDANFWNEKGLDQRFERLNFKNDEEMCAAIADILQGLCMGAAD